MNGLDWEGWIDEVNDLLVHKCHEIGEEIIQIDESDEAPYTSYTFWHKGWTPKMYADMVVELEYY